VVWVEGCSVTDPYHVNNSRGLSGFDLTHVMSVSSIYDLPIGYGKRLDLHNRILNYVLGKWQVNGLLLAHSGMPYNVFVGADIANTGNIGWSQYERANLVGDPHLWHPDRDRWFNAAAFQVPPLYTYGNLGRNRLRSAVFWNLDTSLFRQFPVAEAARLELRSEAFNVSTAWSTALQSAT
jgi:hypothetical protein